MSRFLTGQKENEKIGVEIQKVDHGKDRNLDSWIIN